MCFCGLLCFVRQVLDVFLVPVCRSLNPLRIVFFALCPFSLFAPFSLFVPPVSPRLSLLTVGVLRKGTLGWRMQGWSLGAVIKDFVLRCTFSEMEGFFSTSSLRKVQVSEYF